MGGHDRSRKPISRCVIDLAFEWDVNWHREELRLLKSTGVRDYVRGRYRSAYSGSRDKSRRNDLLRSSRDEKLPFRGPIANGRLPG